MTLLALARVSIFSMSTPSALRGCWRRSALRAFTLIEILVSLVITLIMMGAVVTLFGVVTDSVSGSRALLETSDRLRAARNRIALDLQGATVTPAPPRRPENDEGYLEIVEGPDSDNDNNNMSTTDPPPNPKDFVSFASLFGDCDDAILLTTRSRGEPFIGKLAGVPVESQVAEVAYFLRQDGPAIGFYKSPSNTAKDNQPVRLYTLYRRCMLVRPSGGTIPNITDATFYDNNDISARVDSTPARIANSLGDLTKPENRFGRISTAFPSKFNATLIDGWKTKADGWDLRTPPATGQAAAGQDGFLRNSGRLGDDVLLTNVLAFDVQVFDPGAPVFISTTNPPVAVEPRDSAYKGMLSNTPVSFGAYGDLGYMFNASPAYTPTGSNPRPDFNLGPNAKSGYTTTGTPRPPFVYDTWSMHYEADGVVQQSQIPTTPPSASNLPDAGMNGLDDDVDGLVDEADEFDTLPPYSAPLRGLRITIRVYEPGSQQTRQVTIVQDF